jgi:four helix bundle protein
MTYEEWLDNVPKSLTADALWNLETYRRALFLSDLAWTDFDKLKGDARGKIVARQLMNCAGSVSANIEEGYGRGFGKDYARFLRIALGSARETRGWYFRGRHLIDAKVITHRLILLDEIISGLVTVSNQQRQIRS